MMNNERALSVFIHDYMGSSREFEAKLFIRGLRLAGWRSACLMAIQLVEEESSGDYRLLR